MTRIALVVSDFDGTQLTKDKESSGAAAARCRHRLYPHLQPPHRRDAVPDRAAWDHARRQEDGDPRTTSNEDEGFAKAVDVILKTNKAG